MGVAMLHLDCRLLTLDPPPVGKLLGRVVLHGPENLPCAGDLLSPASSAMSPRRAGTIPWVPWRPPYAILTNAYGNR